MAYVRSRHVKFCTYSLAYNAITSRRVVEGGQSHPPLAGYITAQTEDLACAAVPSAVAASVAASAVVAFVVAASAAASAGPVPVLSVVSSIVPLSDS